MDWIQFAVSNGSGFREYSTKVNKSQKHCIIFLLGNGSIRFLNHSPTLFFVYVGIAKEDSAEDEGNDDDANDPASLAAVSAGDRD